MYGKMEIKEKGSNNILILEMDVKNYLIIRKKADLVL